MSSFHSQCQYYDYLLVFYCYRTNYPKLVVYTSKHLLSRRSSGSGIWEQLSWGWLMDSHEAAIRPFARATVLCGFDCSWRFSFRAHLYSYWFVSRPIGLLARGFRSSVGLVKSVSLLPLQPAIVETPFSIPLALYPQAGLLEHTVILYLIFWETVILVP